MTAPANDYADSIAIVGIGLRFPGANNPHKFWDNLVNGRETVRELPDEELDAAGVAPELRRNPNYVKVAGTIDNVESFDAEFFGLSPREAQVADPQQRVFMECAWEAIEDAGYRASELVGRVGVFAGSGTVDYLTRHVAAHPELHDTLDDLDFVIGTDHDQLPTRVAYRLNLTGPAVAIQTACSTSLVAVHMACESLLSRQCDGALAGGVTIKLPQASGYRFTEGGIGSPDGHTRAFDADARGTVFSSGAGAVMLKRTEDAIRDGDHIYAVILGSAINNDGSAKVGYTAPGVDGQANVIREALAMANVDPASVSYVETHGTGTALGDPIEMTALSRAFREGSPRAEACAIGSVKTNIGHTVAAAGIAGLIKVALALQHQTIPPSLNYSTPNPAIAFDQGPFVVNTAVRRWEEDTQPRRAGVSSFGIGGTNAHAVLQEAPQLSRPGAARRWEILTLSGRTPDALSEAKAKLAAFLSDRPQSSLADVSYTLACGREPFLHRAFTVVESGGDPAQVLLEANGRHADSAKALAERRVAFMFPGGSAQHIGMAAALYGSNAFFRDTIDDYFERLKTHADMDLRPLIFGAARDDAEAAERLARPSAALPAIFAVELALAELWMSWGVRPDVMIGHSMGEYAAAYLAGVVSLDDALALVALRGRLFDQMEPGAMLSVRLPASELEELLSGGVSIAVVNTPGICVVSGPTDGIAAAAERFDRDGVDYVRLQLSMAAHSSLIDPILPAFSEFVRGIKLSPPTIPFVSNLTGQWITDEEATDPGYWTRHLRETVRFDRGLERILEDETVALLEVGPGQGLTAIARQHPAHSEQPVMASLPHPQDEAPDDAFAIATLGRLWAHGVDVDWRAYHAPANPRRIPLPTYPFQRKRYWLDATQRIPTAGRPVQKRGTPAEWFWSEGWKQSPLVVASDARTNVVRAKHWLVFADRMGVGRHLAGNIIAGGGTATLVFPGRTFRKRAKGYFEIRPGNTNDYRTLIQMAGASAPIDHVVHTWGVTRRAAPLTRSGFERVQEHGYASVLALIQALDATGAAKGYGLTVVANRLFSPDAPPTLEPHKATLLGPVMVAQQEYPLVTARLLGVESAGPGAAAAIIDEVAADSAEIVTSFAAGQRWTQSYQLLDLPAGLSGTSIRPGGVYVISGGLGFLGYHIGMALAKCEGVRLVLVGRTALPPREAWETWLATHAPDDATSVRLQRIRALEAAGATVTIYQADVADADAIQRMVRDVRREYGAIHGVIHVAGISDASGLEPLRHTTPELSRRQFAPKVLGLLALDHATKGLALDFRIAVSSSSTALGGLGHGAYVAANAFLDAFARRSAGNKRGEWTSVGWDVMENVAGSGGSATTRAYAMTGTEAESVFDTALHVPLRHTVVSTGDIEQRRNEWLDRTALRKRSSAAAPQETAGEIETTGQARDPLTATMTQLWRDFLGVTNAEPTDDFFEAGGNSLVAVKVFRRIEETYGVKLPLATLYDAATPAALASVLREHGVGAPDTATTAVRPAGTWESLVAIQAGREGRTPFFCVHGIAGNTLNLRDLARHLGEDQPFYALQARGLNGVDPPHETIEETAADYVASIRRVQPRGPYLLGGYSSGGLIAFEMARQLQVAGEEVAALAFLDSFCLAWARKRTRKDRARWFLAGVRHEGLPFVLRWGRLKAPVYASRLLPGRSQQPPDKPVPSPEEAPLIEAGLRAQDRYELVPIDAAAVLFRSRERTEHGYVPRDLGWSAYLSDLLVFDVPGSHESMCEEPHVRMVATYLRGYLDRAVAHDRSAVGAHETGAA